MKAGAHFERIAVPGALEIPHPGDRLGGARRRAAASFDGYVALGCVIRGETYHFEIVASESARGLMDLSIARSIPLGNGILTVENRGTSFIARASVSGKNKGRDAVEACLEVIRHKRDFGKRAH